ncbi:DUF4326 domain-containing protein [Micromonospora sp. CA-259024]|uniref:DUF4326 domain-containing protein n=1 Tax=Micromonospora sp. CA-259024 TaxID=3239965 RepID=UPI003D8C2F0E
MTTRRRPSPRTARTSSRRSDPGHSTYVSPYRPDLRGRQLRCWCVPERCHAEVIAELADSLPTSSHR